MGSFGVSVCAPVHSGSGNAALRRAQMATSPNEIMYCYNSYTIL